MFTFFKHLWACIFIALGFVCVFSSYDITGLYFILKNVFCTDYLCLYWWVKADLRPANSPVVLRIFDPGHGEKIRAPIQDPRPPVFPCCTGGKLKTFKLQSDFTLMKLCNWMMKIFHTDMIQTSDPSMTKWHKSDYIIPGDNLKGFRHHVSLRWLFCSDRLPWRQPGVLFPSWILILVNCSSILYIDVRNVWSQRSWKQVVNRLCSLKLGCEWKKSQSLWNDHHPQENTQRCYWLKNTFSALVSISFLLKSEECGAIKCIIKKSIPRMRYITYTMKWICLRLAFSLRVFWSELFVDEDGHLSFYSFLFHRFAF